MRIMIGWVSGSPKRQLNSSTIGPSAVIMIPQYRMPLYSAPSARMPFDDRLRDVGDEPVAHLGIDDLAGRIGAHPAGVRALVVVEDALVVLRRYQRNHALAVTHHEERQLLALQALFEHNARAGIAQHLAAQHLFGGALRLFLRLRDDYALARGQPIGLDDDGRVKQLQRLRNFFLASDRPSISLSGCGGAA